MSAPHGIVEQRKETTMASSDPVTELDPRFSSEDAKPTPWVEADRALEEARTFWISTVRPDGRPHVTTLIAVWMDQALYFTTGPTERKGRNLAENPHCILTTGCNVEEGMDIVVEGDAVRVTDDAKLQRIADAYETKYGSFWHFDVRDGAFHQDVSSAPGQPEADEVEAWVYEVAPAKVLGFGKGEVYSQTRWRFAAT
jgi:nitroimidazol reductase NimA-like FMN-containing flavoprotein (pyridoxamine 5'-phosphate oxidase superfamily)